MERLPNGLNVSSISLCTSLLVMLLACLVCVHHCCHGRNQLLVLGVNIITC
ncbi:hypothetical protein Pyn_11314 [Prunus yedoensis var. nudiflora]|uniref:Uncharacterized protein n=1 Tax=Prunus yedoensis var. nudiflora TaxID=2094558 RepID=A0A314Y189_PRUYE|nr:hypothetical protein Pyn_11314 [Prunus yedoensis var. nudiflora]